MPDFNTVYANIHSSIQSDRELVSRIYSQARSHGRKNKNEKRYTPIGGFESIRLGVDLYKDHIDVSFGNIVAKMRLLYELSRGKADLSRVYAKLDDNIGILSEDVSFGSRLFEDKTPYTKLDRAVLMAFSDQWPELERTTFWSQNGNSVRNPIIDLDHVSVRKEFEDLVGEWSFEYEGDPRFSIKEAIQQDNNP